MTQVIRKGGSIGEKHFNVVGEYENHEDAKWYASRMRKMRSQGERDFYKITYRVKKIS